MKTSIPFLLLSCCCWGQAFTLQDPAYIGNVTATSIAYVSPPTISAVSVATTNWSDATLTWTTDQSSDSTVNYGTTVSYGSTTNYSTQTTSHSIGISNLLSGTTYYYSVASTNTGGGSASSGSFTIGGLKGMATGVSLLADWTADNRMTNSGVLHIVDNWTNGWDLTNNASASHYPPVQSNVLNGHNALRILPADNGAMIRCTNFLSSQPDEVWIVMSHTNPPSSQATFFDSYNGSYEQDAYLNSAGYHQEVIGAGGTSYYWGSDGTTNKYMMWRFVFNSSSSAAYTNGVLMKSGSLGTGTGGSVGFTLGGEYHYSSDGLSSIVACRVFAGTLSAYAASAMSNFWYQTYFPSGFP